MDSNYMPPPADDREHDEKDLPNGTPNLEALRNLWQARDERYAARKFTATRDVIDLIRAYRLGETRDLSAAQRAVGADEVARWLPPVVVR